MCALSTHAAPAYEAEKNYVILAWFLLDPIFDILSSTALPLPLWNESALLWHRLGQNYRGSHLRVHPVTRTLPVTGYGRCCKFHLPDAAANKRFSIHEPEALQIYLASLSCHQHGQQPAPRTQLASSKSRRVHAEEQDSTIKFLVEIKSALWQSIVVTTTEILWHLLPLRFTCPEPAWCGKVGTAGLRENTWGRTRPCSSKATARCPSTFMVHPPTLRSFSCTNLLITGSKIPPNKSPLHHLPVVYQNLHPLYHLLHLPITILHQPSPLLEMITHVINPFSTGRVSRRSTIAMCRSTRKRGYANTAPHCLFLPSWGN